MGSADALTARTARALVVMANCLNIFIILSFMVGTLFLVSARRAQRLVFMRYSGKQPPKFQNLLANFSI